MPCSARFLSLQASASQPPLPPVLGGAPAAVPEVVVHDEDDTPMPVAITADETNLFQVGGSEGGAGWGTPVQLALHAACTAGACNSGTTRPLANRCPHG